MYLVRERRWSVCIAPSSVKQAKSQSMHIQTHPVWEQTQVFFKRTILYPHFFPIYLEHENLHPVNLLRNW